MELIIEINPELADHLNKCRCCFKSISNDDSSINLTTNMANRFLEITQLELIISELCSSIICESCNLRLNEYSIFKKDLISKQLKLYQFLEDQSITEDFPMEVIKSENISKLDDEIFYMKLELSDNNSNLTPSLIPNTKKKLPIICLKVESESNNLTCPYCQKAFSEKRRVKTHISRMHLKIKKFSCDQCNYTSCVKAEMRRHMRVHLPAAEKAYDYRICPECGKKCHGNNHLNFHIRKAHLKIKRFFCDHCPYSAFERFSMQSHLLQVHIVKTSQKSFQCDSCKSQFVSARNLKVHKRSKHEHINPFICFCGKAFPLNQSLQVHIRLVHRNEKNHKCQLCDKRFFQVGGLNEHMASAHGRTENQIPCPICGKLFRTKNKLTTHQIYHKTPKFNCSVCQKTFYVRNRLREHELVHQGSQFQCVPCNKTFLMKSALQRHMRTTTKHNKNI